MVDRSYMLEQPQPPSELKRYFDQAIIPAAIDMLAAAESGADRLAYAARRTPLTALALALTCGTGLAIALRRARRLG